MSYYAAQSSMGTNYTYESPCWSFFSFETKAHRDRWVDENENTESMDAAKVRKVKGDRGITEVRWEKTVPPGTGGQGKPEWGWNYYQ